MEHPPSSLELFTVNMEALGGRPRTIRVYLPRSYQAGSQGGALDRYPVLFMHDGQNLFDDATAAYGVSWGLKDLLDAGENGAGTNLVVVGVDNGPGLSRLDEYSPWTNHALKYQHDDFINRNVGGEGVAYTRFLVEELKPLIDRRYRVFPDAGHTSLAGSSMGGLISIYAALGNQDVFGRVAAFSSALWFAQDPLVQWVESCGNKGLESVYLDTGTAESTRNRDMSLAYVETNRCIRSALVSVLGQERVSYLEDEGGIHHESAWRRRIAPLLEGFARI